MKRLIEILKPLYLKLFLEKIIRYSLIGLVVGIFLNIILIIFSKFVYIQNIVLLLIFIPIACVFLSFCVVIFKKPSYYETAVQADMLGFKERFITAFEILKQKKSLDNEYNKIIINDVIEKTESVNLNRLYKMKISKRLLKLILFSLCFSMIVGFIPSPNSNEIAEAAEMKAKINKEIEDIKSVKKELNLKSQNSKEVNKKIKELEKELKHVKSKGDAIKAIQKTQAELKKISKNSVSDKLSKIGEKLSQNELTRKFGEQIKNGNVEDMKKNIDDIVNNLKNMTPEQRKQVSNSLKDNLNELAESPEAQNLINELAETMSKELSDENIESINESLNELSNIIDDMAKENSELREVINKLNKQLTDSSANLDEQKMQGQGNSNTNDTSTNNIEQNQNINSTDKSNVESGQQQGQGNKIENGSSQQDRGSGHIENENIYSRDAQNIKDYETQIDSKENNNGTIQQSERNAIGTAGSSIPYDKVYNKYKNEALSSIDDNNIPYGVREIVKDYFSSLE